MRKLILTLMIWLVLLQVTCAQVTLVLQVPPAGVIIKPQLWNMALIYGGNGLITVSVRMTLMSSPGNQPVMTATTRQLVLHKGTNSLSARDLSPLVYNYLPGTYTTDRDPNGLLPGGNFKACYAVVYNVEHGMETLAEDCVPVEVEPISPPQLSWPSDTAVLLTSYPQFSWLPPQPVQLFSDLNYELIVAEVKPGQTAYQSLQQNIPVYNLHHGTQPVDLYPASAAPLDTGRIYSWQVIAKNGADNIAQSEVWTFRIAPKRPIALVPEGGRYLSMRPVSETSGAAQLLTSRVMGIRYYSFDPDQETTVHFYAAGGKEVWVRKEHTVYGDNFLVWELGGSFQEGQQYTVEITDNRKTVFRTGFALSAK